MKSKSNIVVRIPPSPTGYFHIGRARTALFNYLYARKHGGKIVFRLEDTDKERSKKEYEEDIETALAWLGITYDEGPFRQSERTDVYKNYIQKMITDGSAYISHESEGDNKEVVRFKNPNKKITFNDMIRGEITFDTTELKDFVIARNVDEPLYHLTVVVDDHEMGVTHVIRGDDGISNTPRQILIQEAIGAERPEYAHVPLILGSDRAKMSARHGATSLRDFRAKGYLPEAMVNHLALLGWNPGTDEEIFTLEELVEKFDLEKIQKGGAVFDTEKLRWINKEWMKRKQEIINKEIENKIKGKYGVGEAHPELTNAVFERVETLGDVDEMLKVGEWEYFFSAPELEVDKIAWKKSTKEAAKKHLEKLTELIGNDDEVMRYAEGEGKGDVLWPLRYALSGREKSPDPFTLMHVLGPEESIRRVNQAIEILS